MHAIEREGRPPAAVCVHGYCQSAAYWEPTLERLAQLGARGIAVDLPGFAGSANNPGPYTMEGLAEALALYASGDPTAIERFRPASRPSRDAAIRQVSFLLSGHSHTSACTP